MLDTCLVSKAGATVSNDELLAEMHSLMAQGRAMTGRLLLYLIEVEQRRLHLELGYSSVYVFCRRRLKMSEGEAFRRMTAARLVGRFPQLLEWITEKNLYLSNLGLLRDHLTDDNVDELAREAAGKRRRDVEKLIAERFPKPDVVDSIRKLPDPVGPPPMLDFSGGGVASGVTSSSSRPGAVNPNAAAARPETRDAIEPLSATRYGVHFTASQAVIDKLERAQELLSHQEPSGALAVVFEKALDALLAKLEKAKFGKTDRPQAPRSATDPTTITQATRREVHERDGEQCVWTSADGERCNERALLQYDHVDGKARGGTGKPTRVRMLCAAHNRYEAEKMYGRDFIEKKVRMRQRRSKAARPLARPESAEPITPVAPGAVAVPASPSGESSREDVRVAETHAGATTLLTVENALLSLGFRPPEVRRAMSIVGPRATGPVEAILRDALHVLT